MKLFRLRPHISDHTQHKSTSVALYHQPTNQPSAARAIGNGDYSHGLSTNSKTFSTSSSNSFHFSSHSCHHHLPQSSTKTPPSHIIANLNHHFTTRSLRSSQRSQSRCHHLQGPDCLFSHPSKLQIHIIKDKVEDFHQVPSISTHTQ